MTLYEKLNDKYREGKQEGEKLTVILHVQKLIFKGIVSTEKEACELLDLDFNEYLAAKKQTNESDFQPAL